MVKKSALVDSEQAYFCKIMILRDMGLSNSVAV